MHFWKQRTIGSWIFAIAAAASLCLPCAAQRFDDKSASESAIRILRQATTRQRDGSHLALLLALRQLRDPALEPLFHQLIQKGDWPIQVHAVLGLGEIDANRHVNPFDIRQAAKDAQEAIIANALDSELLAEDQFAIVLSWNDLNPMARLLVDAELITRNKPIDKTELSTISNRDDPYSSGLASCLLGQAGDIGPWNAFQSRMNALNADERDRLVLWLLDAIGRYRLTFAKPWLQDLLSNPKANDDVAYRGTYTLMKLDVAAGLAAWNRSIGDNPPHARQVRFVMALLAIGGDVPAGTYDRLQPAPDDELVRTMIAVGKALSNDTDPTTPMMRLLELGHLRSIDWVNDAASKLKPDQAARVYGHVIDLSGNADSPAEIISQAVRAVSKLYAIDPSQVLDRLKNAEDDGLVQQTILLGLLDSRSPQIADAARALPRRGPGRADSLALMLIARNSATLSDDERKSLGIIASGGGRLSDALQVQAAWMYLKHTGQVESSMAMVFAASP